MFEIYEATSLRKHYLVFDRSVKYADAVKAAKVYFCCGEKNLNIEKGWVVDDDLYLEDPHIKGARVVCAVSHWRRA